MRPIYAYCIHLCVYVISHKSISSLNFVTTWTVHTTSMSTMHVLRKQAVIKINAWYKEKLYEEIFCHPRQFVVKRILISRYRTLEELCLYMLLLTEPKHSIKFSVFGGIKKSYAALTHCAWHTSGIITDRVLQHQLLFSCAFLCSV